jgi:SagB-type dehydrogenase family enzyme
MALGVLATALLLRLLLSSESSEPSESSNREDVRLTPVDPVGGMPLREVLAKRRSQRDFTDRALTLDEVAQLCWAAQGISQKEQGFRTAPSAGALYPLTVLIVDREGVHEYLPQDHLLRSTRIGDLRLKLQAAALNQSSVGRAPVCFVITMDVARTASKYGAKAERYCLLEAGHVAQNVLLQATSMGLGGVPIAAFDEHAVARLLQLPSRLQPVYLLPLGQPVGKESKERYP